MDIMIVLLSGFFVLMFLAGLEHSINNPLAAENALQKCQAKGFDYVEDFERQPLSTTPLGVKCNLVDYTQKRVNVDVQDAIPVVVS